MEPSVLLQIHDAGLQTLPWFRIAGVLVIIIILMVLSAIVSGAEVALFSLGPSDLQTLRNKQSRRAAGVLKVLSNPRRMLATLLIANNTINIAIIILSTFVTFEIVDPEENPVLVFVIQAVVVSAVLLFFGEILPKVYATHSPLNYAQSVIPVVSVLYFIFKPLAWVLARFTVFLDNRQGRGSHGPSFNELSEAIELTRDETNDHKILKGIVSFGDIEVKEIMNSRTQISAADCQLSFGELVQLIRETGYSRIPVFSESLDHISGVLYIKDLLPHLDKQSFDWHTLIRPAIFVPEQKKINDLLQEFREKKTHLAVVVDEYGGTSGIVTLEDIIEEVLGEINDEYDTDEPLYTRTENGDYLFDGKTLINDFCKVMEMDPARFDEVKGESETLAGLMLELSGTIPEKNEKVSFQQFDFFVEASDKRRIKKIRVHLNPEKTDLNED